MTEKNKNKKKTQKGIEKAREIIENSGNSFHYEVVQYLRSRSDDKKWEVSISPYYSDNVTGKAREVDIIAESYRIKEEYAIKLRLFIECKKSASETVLWFDKMEYEKAYNLAKENMNLPEGNKIINSHHYLDREDGGKVVKIFDSAPSRNQENDPFYKALNQSLSALISFREESFFTEEGKEKEKIIRQKNLKKYILNYPLIVLQNFNHLYRVDIDNTENDPISLKDEDSFLIEINYAYLDKNNKSCCEYFLVDVVNFEKIDVFLANKLESCEIRGIDRVEGP